MRAIAIARIRWASRSVSFTLTIMSDSCTLATPQCAKPKDTCANTGKHNVLHCMTCGITGDATYVCIRYCKREMYRREQFDRRSRANGPRAPPHGQTGAGEPQDAGQDTSVRKQSYGRSRLIIGRVRGIRIPLAKMRPPLPPDAKGPACSRALSPRRAPAGQTQPARRILKKRMLRTAAPKRYPRIPGKENQYGQDARLHGLSR